MRRINHTMNELVIKSRRIQPGEDPATYNPFNVKPSPSRLLDTMRSEVEDIDYEIYKLLERRFKVTDMIGSLKKKHNIPIENLEVEAFKLAAVPNELKSIYQFIFNESKKRQEVL
ncbi:hypothetical protein [Serratia phage X20]|uniref:Chorismate mutase domain-containing protein n=3 Tax=Winklervirus TaxID=2560256 RepID=A0A1Z1LYV0_9CAUD|nr:hypothetical protein FDI23_gp039 [Serratia phage CHI14]YP_010092189.1 hypothetical protein KNT72_gp038 [Serratia phage X20]ARW57737.1 hypothetical protein [Serratia phage CBH8]QYN80484.1 hypothetical protein [Kosakonia phage Kc304]UJJ22021.1 putative chorismate mutase [Erwinia phage Virsaitis27]UYM28691.1 chorismate mutase domain-containing protein [Serratia phage vB_SspM_LC53]ARW57462.1 hypothetical protein [Serratia phage CHI14]